MSRLQDPGGSIISGISAEAEISGKPLKPGTVDMKWEPMILLTLRNKPFEGSNRAFKDLEKFAGTI